MKENWKPWSIMMFLFLGIALIQYVKGENIAYTMRIGETEPSICYTDGVCLEERETEYAISFNHPDFLETSFDIESVLYQKGDLLIRLEEQKGKEKLSAIYFEKEMKKIKNIKVIKK